jgi:hypothetical protein
MNCQYWHKLFTFREWVISNIPVIFIVELAVAFRILGNVPFSECILGKSSKDALTARGNRNAIHGLAIDGY